MHDRWREDLSSGKIRSCPFFRMLYITFLYQNNHARYGPSPPKAMSARDVDPLYSLALLYWGCTRTSTTGQGPSPSTASTAKARRRVPPTKPPPHRKRFGAYDARLAPGLDHVSEREHQGRDQTSVHDPAVSIWVSVRFEATSEQTRPPAATSEKPPQHQPSDPVPVRPACHVCPARHRF